MAPMGAGLEPGIQSLECDDFRFGHGTKIGTQAVADGRGRKKWYGKEGCMLKDCYTPVQS
jgi:hypothetical protein